MEAEPDVSVFISFRQQKLNSFWSDLQAFLMFMSSLLCTVTMVTCVKRHRSPGLMMLIDHTVSVSLHSGVMQVTQCQRIQLLLLWLSTTEPAD